MQGRNIFYIGNALVHDKLDPERLCIIGDSWSKTDGSRIIIQQLFTGTKCDIMCCEGKFHKTSDLDTLYVRRLEVC